MAHRVHFFGLSTSEHGSANCDGKIPVGSKLKTPKKTDSRPMIPYLRAKHHVFRNYCEVHLGAQTVIVSCQRVQDAPTVCIRMEDQPKTGKCVQVQVWPKLKELMRSLEAVRKRWANLTARSRGQTGQTRHDQTEQQRITVQRSTGTWLNQ